MNYMDIANSWPMWLCCIPCVLSVIYIAVKFSKYSMERGRELGMSREDCRTGLRAGAIAAIGPALSMFTVMIALMAVLGGPFAWLRLSVLGGAPTEMMGATVGAQAAGVELGGTDYTLIPYASSVWTITLNTVGWSMVVFFFNHRMERIKVKIEKFDTGIMAVIGSGALLGALSLFANIYGFSKGKVGSIAVLVAMASAVGISLIAKVTKIKRLEEFNVGISMFVGMLVAQCFA